MGEIERYRARAEDMWCFATTAKTSEQAAIYRELAYQWETLADRVAAIQNHVEPWPDLEDEPA